MLSILHPLRFSSFLTLSFVCFWDYNGNKFSTPILYHPFIWISSISFIPTSNFLFSLLHLQYTNDDSYGGKGQDTCGCNIIGIKNKRTSEAILLPLFFLILRSNWRIDTRTNISFVYKLWFSTTIISFPTIAYNDRRTC